MKRSKALKAKRNKVASILFLALIFQVDLSAGGISVDAGLTPPQDRFIFRFQYRYMSMDNAMMSMNTHMMPVVLAYGVSSGFTLMARGMYVHQAFENPAMTKSGINDLYVLSKFRLFRKNAANYVFGIAPHIAFNVPVGSNEISNRTWNPELGLNISFRPRFFSVDLSTSYVFSDITGKLTSDPGNILNINTALSAQIPLKTNSSSSLSPLIEMTYLNQAESEAEPRHEILFLSPGISFIRPNLALEFLLQIPVYQTEIMDLMHQNQRLVVGVKYMF